MSLAIHTGVGGLGDEEGGEFGEAAFVEPFVELAFVAAVGGVGAEDVAVTTFQLFVEGAFVDGTGADVVGQGGSQHGVSS